MKSFIILLLVVTIALGLTITGISVQLIHAVGDGYGGNGGDPSFPIKNSANHATANNPISI
jgi:hypothetical protein